MTVGEVCKKNNPRKGFWLCPNICRNQSITPSIYECGIYYQNVGAIPTFIAERDVIRTFNEDGLMCLVWNNEVKE